MKKIIALILAIATVFLTAFFLGCERAEDEINDPSTSPDPANPVEDDADGDTTDWYQEGIDYCFENGIMIDRFDFDPEGKVTRAEIAYALWCLERKPMVEQDVTFDDVDASSEYAKAIAWAVSTNIIPANGNNVFTPEGSVTRERFAVILYRYAETKSTFIPAYGTALAFADKSLSGFWAREALSWCVKNGIMEGVGNEKLDPKSAALRSHVATMIFRYCDMISGKKATCVYYSDFGAVGDGKTDDFDAIVKTHEFANERGLSVCADEGATYYIGESRQTAVIRTNTTWTGASFIIDDSNLVPFQSSINTLFSVVGDEYVSGFDVDTLQKGQKHIGFAPGEKLLVTVENYRFRHFIRSGPNANDGTAMSDTFIVDEDGNILSDIIWDFDVVTYCKAKRLSKPITIDGGTFLIKVNRHPSRSYFSRNITITRSNTTVQNLTMKIIDEGDVGSPYAGFIMVVETAYVTLRNINIDAYNAFRTGIGTYGFQLNYCANITLENVIQTNDILDEGRWGIMCTNFCKDIVVKNSRINRFDAHMGVTNCTIENSVVGSNGVNIIGHGTFILRNSTVYDSSLVTLRSDYGSTWDGDVYIENVEWHPGGGRAPSVINGSNSSIHDYGYTCYQPRNVYIDGLYIADADITEEDYLGPRLLCYYSLSKTVGTVSPYILCEKVVAKNVTTESGMPVYLSFYEKDYPDVIWEISESNIIEEFSPIPEQLEWLTQES